MVAFFRPCSNTAFRAEHNLPTHTHTIVDFFRPCSNTAFRAGHNLQHRRKVDSHSTKQVRAREKYLKGSNYTFHFHRKGKSWSWRRLSPIKMTSWNPLQNIYKPWAWQTTLFWQPQISSNHKHMQSQHILKLSNLPQMCNRYNDEAPRSNKTYVPLTRSVTVSFTASSPADE